MIFCKMLLYMLALHAVADFPAQGPFLSAGKNRRETPYGSWIPWYYLMASHAVIHAGAVLWITNSLTCALAESVIHFATDTAKCEGKISNRTDQGIHIGCKVLWATLTVWVHLP